MPTRRRFLSRAGAAAGLTEFTHGAAPRARAVVRTVVAIAGAELVAVRVLLAAGCECLVFAILS